MVGGQVVLAGAPCEIVEGGVVAVVPVRVLFTYDMFEGTKVKGRSLHRFKWEIWVPQQFKSWVTNELEKWFKVVLLSGKVLLSGQL